MSRKDNDSLEEFFRKATRHHDLEYNEEDWKKLERMLDEQQPVHPVGWFSTHGRKAIVGLAVVAGLVATLFLLPVRQGTDAVVMSPADNSAMDSKAQQESEILQQPNEAQAPPSIAERESQVRERISPDAGQRSATPEREQNSSAQGNASAPITRRLEIASGVDTESPGARSVIPNRDGNRVESTKGRAIETNPDIDNRKDPSEVSGFNHTQVESRAPAERTGNAEGAHKQVAQVQVQPADSASVDISADALEAPASGRRAFDETRSRFGISVMAAPDFSRTARGGAMGTGDAAGVFFHYKVLPRWEVTTGVMYTNKKYWGRGDEYQPPRGYWKALTNGVVPDRIDGTCSMYEVPIAVTFDILSTRRTRLFASAGLSSYFVQSEEYYYHFDTPNPGAVNGWTGKKPSTLWFGIGTLSAGLDFRATRTLSIGVEPYFKMPLEGMGWADIDLYSTGVMFAARYHFAKKANKHPPTLQGP